MCHSYWEYHLNRISQVSPQEEEVEVGIYSFLGWAQVVYNGFFLIGTWLGLGKIGHVIV